MSNRCLQILEEELVHVAARQCASILACDVTQCLRCGACEEACGRRHGQSRLSGEWRDCGVLRVAPACRQCVDPACCAACRRQALRRKETGVAFEPAACVGCGACSRACPFGAIRVEGKDGKEPQSSGAGDRLVSLGSGRAINRCDGCRGSRHPACVHECPTGALAFHSHFELWRAVRRGPGRPAVELAGAALAAAEAARSGRDAA